MQTPLMAPADSYISLPPMYYDQRQRRYGLATTLDYCCSFLLAAACFAVFLFSIVSLSVLIICLIMQPQLATVRVDSATATLTSLNNTTANLTDAAFNFTFVVRNPDYFFGVSYKDLEARVWFGNNNRTLASTRLKPFSQDAETETRVQAQMAVVNGSVIDGGVAAEIAAERGGGGGGSVRFGVSLFGSILFSYDQMQHDLVPLRFECDTVIMEFQKGTDTGTLVGPSVICSEV